MTSVTFSKVRLGRSVSRGTRGTIPKMDKRVYDCEEDVHLTQLNLASLSSFLTNILSRVQSPEINIDIVALITGNPP
jgi:hypothetical protein